MCDSTKTLLITLALILTSCSTDKKPRESLSSLLKYASFEAEVPEVSEDGFAKYAKNKILVLLPLSGNNENLGRDIVNAVTLAVTESENKNTDFWIVDTEDPKNSKIKLYDRFKNTEFTAIIGPVFYGEARQFGSLFPKVPIFTLSNNPKVNNDHVFSCGVSPRDEIRSIFSFIKSSNIDGLLAFIPNGSVGDQILSCIKQEMKRRNISKEEVEFIRYDRISRQNATELAQNSEKNAIFAMEPIFDIRELNGKQVITLCSSVQMDPTLWKGAVYAFTKSKAMTEFSENYRAKFKKSPQMIETVAYDITNALLDSINFHESEEEPVNEKDKNKNIFLGRHSGCLGDYVLRKNSGCIRKLKINFVTD